jgi:hypothetical protein
MAIVAEITNALLGMAGLEEVSHGPTGLEERIIQDINRGLEHVGESNPNIFYQTRPDQAEVIRPPATVTVTCVQYSKAVTFTSGYVSTWMPGCAILINGDSTLNRIEDEASPSAPSLSQPYMGASGTVQAVVYHDWISVPVGVRTVMDPVSLDKQTILLPAQGASDLNMGWMNYSMDFDRRYAGLVLALQKQVQLASRYWPYAQMVLGTLRGGLMLDTLPGEAHKLVYDAKKLVFAPVTTLADTRTTLMPQGKDVEILLPVVRWFFASYQFCSIPKSELQDDYTLAMTKAAQLTIAGNIQKRYRYSQQR